MSKREAAIALTRFGMGARPGEIESIAHDPKGWLLNQAEQPQKALLSNEGLMSTPEATRFVVNGIQRVKEAKNSFEEGKTDAVAVNAIRRNIRTSFQTYFELETHNRNRHASITKSGFAERWVRFWSNHFTVSCRHPNLLPLVNAFEREAIRPHVFGNFSDLLNASTFHPAMLSYLDNNVSVGPTSKAVEWAKSVGRTPPGLNENLAREILELHTLGVDGGYLQSDILAFAEMLTGWTILGLPSFLQEGPANVGDVMFYSKKHEKKEQVFLNKIYPSLGADQAKMALNEISKHPSTAHFIAKKLVRHFIDDKVNPADVKILETVFIETQGNLKEMARALVKMESMWKSPRRKFKTPEELIVSTARALGISLSPVSKPTTHHKVLGQIPFMADSPEGWSDIADDWAGSDSLKKRIEWAYELGSNTSNAVAATEFLKNALGDHVSFKTLSAVKRAENGREALAVAIMSPEFQRR